ncbi:MAG: zinc-dependent metalloprotease [Bdellovibrionales bacterium]
MTTTKLKLIAAGTLALAVAVTGCTKKRSERLDPNAGDNLSVVSQYQGKVFSLTTLDSIKGEQPNLSNAAQKKFDAKSFGVDQFTLVNYETKAELLGKSTRLLARPNTAGIYEIHYYLTDDYLKVLKVAQEKDIPLVERTFNDADYVKTVLKKDGWMAIPVVGYKIQGKYVLTNRKNDLGEKSSILREQPVTSIDQATHFRVDFNSRELFQALQKPDLLPVSFFEGEWFYAETIVQAPDHEKENESALAAGTRVKFIKNQSNFEAVNLNLDKRLKDQSDVNFERVFLIPVEWKEYRARPLGRSSGMQEEENNEIRWSDRRFVAVDFAKAQTMVSNNKDARARLVGLEIEDNYLSFTLEHATGSFRYKVSLRRAKPTNYDRKLHFVEDWNQFGFFTTFENTVFNHEVYRKKDIDSRRFISRFNPKSNSVEFRFSRTTPTWLRSVSRLGILNWDYGFCQARYGEGSKNCRVIHQCKVAQLVADGKSDKATLQGATKNLQVCDSKKLKELMVQTPYIQVVLNEADGDVDLGDLRYNIINIIESATSHGLYGYGPSLTDPYTGEIISATANVHITPMLETLIQDIRNYIMMELGILKGTYVGSSGHLFATSDPKKMTVNKEKNVVQFVLDSVPTGLGNIHVSKDILTKMGFPTAELPADQEGRVRLDFRQGNRPFGREYDLGISAKNIHRDIQRSCPEVSSYIKSLKASKVTHNSNELTVLNSCAKELVGSKMLGTLVHELGHNFGLRHNFAASTDTPNFWSTSETQTDTVVRSSSIMEYPDAGEERLVQLGKYDIAALRYGYYDSVQLKEGRIEKLETQLPISQQKVQVQQLRSYKFCTDEHTGSGLDPMCRRFDAGTTPTEIMDNFIAGFRTSFALRNYRYDRLNADGSGMAALIRLVYYYGPMKHFYEEYRNLLAHRLGTQNMYLERLDDKALTTLIQQMEQDKETGALFKEYRLAGEKAFNFLSSLMAMPDNYCLVKIQKSGQFELIEFDKMRRDLTVAPAAIRSCSDPAATSWLTARGLNLVQQFGYPVRDVRFDLRTESKIVPYDHMRTENLDIVGTALDRSLAANMLTARSTFSMKNRELDFAPSFLDEPRYRERYTSLVMSRLAGGISTESLRPALASVLPGDKVEEIVKSKSYFQKFEAEEPLILEQITSLFKGLLIPGNDDENIRRRRSFEIMHLVSPTEIEQLQRDQRYTVVPHVTGAFVIRRDQKLMASLAAAGVNADMMKRFQGFQRQTVENLMRVLSSLKLPKNDEAAKGLTLQQYLMGFRDASMQFQALLQKDPQLQMLVGYFFQDIGQMMQQAMQLDQMATVAKAESLEKFVRDMVEAQMPNESAEKKQEAVEAQMEEFESQQISEEKFKDEVRKAQKRLKKAEKDLSVKLTEALKSEGVLTEERLKSIVQNRMQQMDRMLENVALNRSDISAQHNLLLKIFGIMAR